MTEGVRAVIGCSPAAWDMEWVAPGSVQIDAACGHRVWIAPASLSAHLAPYPPTVVRCIPCVMVDPEMRASVAKHGLHAFPGQREEMAAELGQEETDAFFAAMNIKEELPE